MTPVEKLKYQVLLATDGGVDVHLIGHKRGLSISVSDEMVIFAFPTLDGVHLIQPEHEDPHVHYTTVEEFLGDMSKEFTA